MKIMKVSFAVFRFQYQIARLPLQVIEDQRHRPDEFGIPRPLVLRALLGTLDATWATSWATRGLRSAAVHLPSAAMLSVAQPSSTRPRTRYDSNPPRI